MCGIKERNVRESERRFLAVVRRLNEGNMIQQIINKAQGLKMKGKNIYIGHHEVQVLEESQEDHFTQYNVHQLNKAIAQLCKNKQVNNNNTSLTAQIHYKRLILANIFELLETRH